MTKGLLTAFAISTLLVGCQADQTTEATKLVPATEMTKTASGGIVYINTDSLVSGYDYYIELKAKFDKRADGVQKELEKKSRSLERKVSDFQNKITKGLVTRAQAAELEQKLTAEQQSVLQYRDKVLAELQEEERVLFNNINNDVEVFIKKYNAEKNYDMIISTNSSSSTVLIGNPSLDVTTEVLEGMNSEYKSRETATK